MSINASPAVLQKIPEIKKGVNAAINLYSRQEEVLEHLAAQLEERLRPDAITLDVGAYTSFEDLERELIMYLWLREDKPEDCCVTEEAIAEQDPDRLHCNVDDLLNDIGVQEDSWICLILKHFDAAEGYWDDGDYGWVREMVDGGIIDACIVLSSVPMQEVTERPVGSSPLYNIFSPYSLDEEE